MKKYMIFPIFPIIIILFSFLFAFLLTSIFDRKKYTFHLSIIFFLIFIGFFVGFLGFRAGKGGFFEILYFIQVHLVGAIWLTFLGIIPVFFFRLFWKKPFSQFGKIAIILGLVGCNIFGLYNGYITTIREVAIELPTKNSLSGKNIILLADTHYGAIFGKNSAEKLVSMLNNIDAEFILIAGDLFDGPNINFEEIAHTLSKINKPIYYAVGNHEEYGDIERMLQALGAANFTILNNEGIVEKDIFIAGVTYHENLPREAFENTLENLTPNNENLYKILIKHTPTHLDLAEKYGYHLTVSGHTHRGQMWPFSLIVDHMYGSYSHGLTKHGDTFSYTTTGVGGWGPPQRLGSQSEIVVIHAK